MNSSTSTPRLSLLLLHPTLSTLLLRPSSEAVPEDTFTILLLSFMMVLARVVLSDLEVIETLVEWVRTALLDSGSKIFKEVSFSSRIDSLSVSSTRSAFAEPHISSPLLRYASSVQGSVRMPIPPEETRRRQS